MAVRQAVALAGANSEAPDGDAQVIGEPLFFVFQRQIAESVKTSGLK
ncbi:hypothetical protein ACWD00_41005 [Streptomyces viridiviolaceus]